MRKRKLSGMREASKTKRRPSIAFPEPGPGRTTLTRHAVGKFMANSSGQYTVTEIIDALRSNKLVPSKTADSTLRGLKGHFERLQQGTELKDWGCDGRPPLKSILEVEELVDNHAGSVGPIDMKASLKKAHTDQEPVAQGAGGIESEGEGAERPGRAGQGGAR